MAKQADTYFKLDPWKIIETGFDPAYGEVAESIFSLGNEYMGLRGYFEEGYSGPGLQGSYVGGVYERRMLHSGYKSSLPFTEMMINTVDWVHLGIWCNGVKLDLAKVKFSDFSRVLDLRSGALTRRFIWQVDEGTALDLTFERFLSMPRPPIGAQSLRIQVLRGLTHMRLEAGLDFSRLHRTTGQNHWQCDGAAAQGDNCHITGTTHHTAQQLFAAARFRGLESKGKPQVSDQYAGLNYEITLSKGEQLSLSRLVKLLRGRDFEDQRTFKAACTQAQDELNSLDYQALLEEATRWWALKWQASDIQIHGDPEGQQGIRYSIFQLHQTLHTALGSAVIGAKGLTGEAYNGNAFWDSEVYCLPFYLFNNPEAARNILQFRYDTLPEAKARAQALDLKGAFYPIATISGHECCDLWQHASLQLQASTAVGYGLWHYVKVTGDKSFLYNEGAQMLVEICRMLNTRGNYSPLSGKYSFYGVMGPDEFQMMVNHNAYTNIMAQRTFDYTIQVLAQMRLEKPEAYQALIQQTGLEPWECDQWRQKSQDMYIPYDDKGQIFEQHQGFFDLPHVDIGAIPMEEFPLYSHWAYDRIYRNDMIKQPDVLMFMLLFISSYSKEQLEANFDYYAPRCIHESSLSPSVHSILAADLGRMDEAYEYFGFATRLDLDNYNRNTCEGLHTTALAASWMNIVYGFGGLRSDGDTLAFWPRIPAAWQGYSFSIRYGGAVLTLEVSAKETRLYADRDDAPKVLLYGKLTQPNREGLCVPIGG